MATDTESTVRLRIPVGREEWFNTEDESMLKRLSLSPDIALEYGLLFWEAHNQYQVSGKMEEFYDLVVGEVHEMLDPSSGDPGSAQHQLDFAQNADRFTEMVRRHTDILNRHFGTRVFSQADHRPNTVTLERLSDSSTIVSANYG